MYTAIVLIDGSSPLEEEVVVPETDLTDWELVGIGSNMPPVQLTVGSFQIKASETSESESAQNKYRVKGAYLVDSISTSKLGVSTGMIKVSLSDVEQVQKLLNDFGNAIVTVSGTSGTLDLTECTEEIHSRGLADSDISKRVRPALSRAGVFVGMQNL